MDSRLSRRAVLKALLTGTFLSGCRVAVGISPTAAIQNTLPVSPTRTPRPTSSDTPVPTSYQAIVSPSPVVAISAGGANSLALRADGRVWAWGSALSFGLEEEFLFTPIELEFIDNVAFIDTDDWQTSLFVDHDGQIFRTGYPDETPRLTRIQGIDGVSMARAYRGLMSE